MILFLGQPTDFLRRNLASALSRLDQVDSLLKEAERLKLELELLRQVSCVIFLI